jgi:hypothetical protein
MRFAGYAEATLRNEITIELSSALDNHRTRAEFARKAAKLDLERVWQDERGSADKDYLRPRKNEAQNKIKYAETALERVAQDLEEMRNQRSTESWKRKVLPSAIGALSLVLVGLALIFRPGTTPWPWSWSWSPKD